MGIAFSVDLYGRAVGPDYRNDEWRLGVVVRRSERRWREKLPLGQIKEPCARHVLRYTANSVFDSFPWPQAPTMAAVQAVVDVVERLMDFRDERLASGITPGRQYRSLRDPGRNPLRRLHEELDRAVAAAYGFSFDEDPLAQLLALNESVASEEEAGLTPPRGTGARGLDGVTRTTSAMTPSVLFQPLISGR